MRDSARRRDCPISEAPLTTSVFGVFISVEELFVFFETIWVHTILFLIENGLKNSS